MLRLLAGYPDLEVDRTAAAVIEAGLLMRPIPDWALEMVDEALKRYGDEFAATGSAGTTRILAAGRSTPARARTLCRPSGRSRRASSGSPKALPAVAPVQDGAAGVTARRQA